MISGQRRVSQHEMRVYLLGPQIVTADYVLNSLRRPKATRFSGVVKHDISTGDHGGLDLLKGVNGGMVNVAIDVREGDRSALRDNPVRGLIEQPFDKVKIAETGSGSRCAHFRKACVGKIPGIVGINILVRSGHSFEGVKSVNIDSRKIAFRQFCHEQRRPSPVRAKFDDVPMVQAREKEADQKIEVHQSDVTDNGSSISKSKGFPVIQFVGNLLRKVSKPKPSAALISFVGTAPQKIPTLDMRLNKQVCHSLSNRIKVKEVSIHMSESNP